MLRASRASFERPGPRRTQISNRGASVRFYVDPRHGPPAHTFEVVGLADVPALRFRIKACTALMVWASRAGLRSRRGSRCR